MTMSSFNNPHHMYLFELVNGKKRLAYGRSPADAIDILRMRLTEEEMKDVIAERHVRISQRDLQKHVAELG
jgi:hypothetical protein